MAELVQLNGNEIQVITKTVAEAKQALKELKLMKKELSLEKRIIIEKQKEIRADYTQEVRSRGSMIRGRGAFLSLIRTTQSISRDARRNTLANDLAPLENKKREIDALIRAVDMTIINVESEILKQSK